MALKDRQQIEESLTTALIEESLTTALIEEWSCDLEHAVWSEMAEQFSLGFGTGLGSELRNQLWNALNE